MLQLLTENKLGSDLSGSSGTSNRVLTLSNTYMTVNNGFVVSLGGFGQAIGTDYTINHLATSSTVTFLNHVYNTSPIEVIYFQSIPDPTSSSLIYGMDPLTENWLGSNCTGVDATANRKLVLNNQKLTSGTGFMVFLGGFSQGLKIGRAHV